MDILNLISVVLYSFFIKQVDCYTIAVYKISKTKGCVLNGHRQDRQWDEIVLTKSHSHYFTQTKQRHYL